MSVLSRDLMLSCLRAAAAAATAAAKSFQSCPTLGDPVDGSPTGSAVPGILQARTLEWVAISSSQGSSLTQESHPGKQLGYHTFLILSGKQLT